VAFVVENMTDEEISNAPGLNAKTAKN